MDATWEMDYCSSCQIVLIPGDRDLFEVCVAGVMAPLCASCFAEWNAGKFGDIESLVLPLRRLPTLAHA